MPSKAPRICICGKAVPYGERCACRRVADNERKARFDKTRPSSAARGYTKEWSTESKAYLRMNPRCRRCGGVATLVHHIIAHKGNQGRFWDRSNWLPLCQPCHDGPVQSAERRGVVPNFLPSPETGGPTNAQYRAKTGFSAGGAK